MRKRRILVTNAGRGPAINFCRSLRLGPEPYHLIGTEQSPYSIVNAEVDERYLVPSAEHPTYWPVLQEIIAKTKPDFLYASKTNEELWLISRRRHELSVPILLPAHEMIEVYENKWETYRRFKEAGLRVPETVYIHTEDDLREAMNRFERIWLRAIIGCGGNGSLPTDDFEMARSWINRFKGWGKFTAAEVLSDKTATWLGIWNEGELVVSQVRKRLYWEYSYLAPSGVTGITGAQVTAKDPQIDDIALRAIAAVDPKPHGVVSVDLTYDHQGVPNPTEIQASRFFTSTYFLAKAGLNMPRILVRLALDGEIPFFANRFSPLPPDHLWIKYVDCLPQLTTLDEMKRWNAERDDLIQRLSTGKVD